MSSTTVKPFPSETQDSLPSILEHLGKLVSFDTQNPPRAIAVDSPIFTYLQQALAGFHFKFYDAGDGAIALLATRGNPQLLFNFHIDTVPVAEGWSKDPFQLSIEEEKVFALGACDIKGAAACMLSAVSKSQGDAALLFSSDEEHGKSDAIKNFLEQNHDFTQVIVAEPTQAKAVVAHRGIHSASIEFTGVPGHASEHRALKDNAIHHAGQWIDKAVVWVESQTQSFDELTGLPFNVGTISGGLKPNMIAGQCQLAFGFRPLPGQSAESVLSSLGKLATKAAGEPSISSRFDGPSLPAANQDFAKAISLAQQLADENDLPYGSAVNFWTEASLFSQAGMTALVYGPGDIAQAHTADEWVAKEQLVAVESAYLNILNKTSGQTLAGQHNKMESLP